MSGNPVKKRAVEEEVQGQKASGAPRPQSPRVPSGPDGQKETETTEEEVDVDHRLRFHTVPVVRRQETTGDGGRGV